MAFVKLDCGILDSTLWLDREAREIFLTTLLMSDPYELKEPTPQIEVTTLNLTGWVVPPGWYGFARAAGSGLIHRAGINQTTGREALERLCSPESVSRTPDFEGRRLARVAGGYIVLNFMRYRDRDYTSADRSKRYRERLNESRRSVTASRRDITQAEAEGEEESTEVRTVDRSTYRTTDRNLLSTATGKKVAAVNENHEPSGYTRGPAEMGALPKDHLKHVVCSYVNMDLCVGVKLFETLWGIYNTPDRNEAVAAVERWLKQLEDRFRAGGKSPGGFTWMVKEFRAWLVTEGRVPENTKPTKQSRTPEQIKADVRAHDAEQAKKKAARR